MSRIETTYTVDGQTISYEVLEDGYMVYMGGKPWIHQYEPYIPYPELGHEGSCLRQIEESDKAMNNAQPKTEIELLKEQVSTMEDVLNLLLVGGEL